MVAVFNDNAYGNVLRDQVDRFEGRTIGAELHNSEFMEPAETHGVPGMRAVAPEELETSLGEAIAYDCPTFTEAPRELCPRPLSKGRSSAQGRCRDSAKDEAPDHWRGLFLCLILVGCVGFEPTTPGLKVR